MIPIRIEKAYERKGEVVFVCLAYPDDPALVERFEVSAPPRPSDITEADHLLKVKDYIRSRVEEQVTKDEQTEVSAYAGQNI